MENNQLEPAAYDLLCECGEWVASKDDCDKVNCDRESKKVVQKKELVRTEDIIQLIDQSLTKEEMPDIPLSKHGFKRLRENLKSSLEVEERI